MTRFGLRHNDVRVGEGVEASCEHGESTEQESRRRF
jgi:hypothetical protein